ncbi:MAG: zinc-ribbon domain-containing protein [Hyphomicrobiales bacterium]
MPKPSESYNLYVLRPDLAREWHPTKNGSLGPKDVTPGSRRQAWWLCEKGHWWQARICDRSRGMKCTFCRDLNRQSEQRMVDLRPELIKEWHPSRNGDLRARDASSQHKDKVWWICGQGHEWEATIRSRLSGKACPFCGQPSPGPNASVARSSRPTPVHPSAEVDVSWSGQRPFTAWREEPAAPHDGPELRRSRRYERSAVVMIEKPRSGILGYAHLHNFSAGGLMLFSDFALRPGEVISVRIETPLYPSAARILTSRVVWCRDVEAQGEERARFGIGVRLI